MSIRRSHPQPGAPFPATTTTRRGALALATLVVGASFLHATPSGAASPQFDSRQIGIARTVHDVGKDVGASDRAMLAAMETALVESELGANLGKCEQDHDSAGVFQQRRSWVPAEEEPGADGWCVPGKDPRLNPKWAALHFFNGSPGHPGALAYDKRGTDAHGRRISTAGQLAQATQVSKKPKEYDTREAEARSLLKQLDGQPDDRNRYTPEQVCGEGFEVIDRADLRGRGTVYLLWKASSRENCVVTLKSRDVGKRTPTSAFLQPQGQARARDAGSYDYFAGPVTRRAPGCITWGGAIDGVSYSSTLEHCGSR